MAGQPTHLRRYGRKVVTPRVARAKAAAYVRRHGAGVVGQWQVGVVRHEAQVQVRRARCFTAVEIRVIVMVHR